MDRANGDPRGLRRGSGSPITTAATQSFDLSAWKNHWVKILADQDLYFAFSTHAHDNSAGPGDLSTGNVAVDEQATVAGLPGGYKIVADELTGGRDGTHRFVDPKYPFLLVKAISASTTRFVVKPTSDKLVR